MQLKIKKQTEETITIETPKYFERYGTISKLCEKGVTKVGGDIIIHYAKNESIYFSNEVMELLEKATVVTEEVFLQQLETTLETLKNIVHGTN